MLNQGPAARAKGLQFPWGVREGLLTRLVSWGTWLPVNCVPQMPGELAGVTEPADPGCLPTRSAPAAAGTGLPPWNHPHCAGHTVLPVLLLLKTLSWLLVLLCGPCQRLQLSQQRPRRGSRSRVLVVGMLGGPLQTWSWVGWSLPPGGGAMAMLLQWWKGERC